MENTQAQTIMRPKEISLTLGMTLDEVSDHLTKYQLPGSPVVNDEGELVGYVSEFDCLKQLMQSSYYHVSASRVEDVMSTNTITSRAATSLIDLATEIMNAKVNVMPLLDDDGEFVGLVTRGDVMRALVSALSEKQTVV